jgi:hypothetical protein
MDRSQADVGFRFFSGTTTVDLTRNSSLVISNPVAYTVYGIKVLTDVVIDETASELADGFDGNLSALGSVTLTPGDYFMRFKTLVILSGSGFAYLEG